jgi:hypothetical protein
MPDTIIHLSELQFGENEKPLVESGVFSASTFRYKSGVCALRLKNDRGELVLLPYQGQQIWSATMDGRGLTMGSMFDQPHPTQEYLATYGAFFIHCGATAMGAPGPSDSHSLHGELPLAHYEEAHLVLGEDEHGPFIGMGGTYRHTRAFNFDYVAQPLVKLYGGSSMMRVSMTVKNLKKTDMPLMYLAHINFTPVDYGRLVDTAICGAETMRVREEIPSHISVLPGYREFIQELKAHPEKHLVLKPGLLFDPEVVFFIDYFVSDQGWATAMQVHPDGKADIVRFRPDQLDHGIRWICRTGDQNALGLIPATAEVSGYTAEKAKGNVRRLGAGESFFCEMEIGALSADEARNIEAEINKLVEMHK